MTSQMNRAYNGKSGRDLGSSPEALAEAIASTLTLVVLRDDDGGRVAEGWYDAAADGPALAWAERLFGRAE